MCFLWIRRSKLNMAKVVITLRIMPESPESDLESVEAETRKAIERFSGERDMKVEQQPVAFGLKSLNVIFVMDESKGDTEELEKEIAGIAGVSSVKVTDVRRAIG